MLEPPGEAGEGPFPVVYFLHDIFGDDAVLWRHGVAQRLRARMATGELPPFLLVAPAGGRSFWSDFHDGSRRFETWIGEELPRQIAARYPVRRGPSGRAMTGISMGGYGAFKVALRNPRQVGAAASLSGVVPPLDWGVVEDANPIAQLFMKRVFGRDREENGLRREDLFRLLPRLYEVPRGERPRLLLRAGTEDGYRLDEAAYLFHTVARDYGVEVELVLEAGNHGWGYWSASVEEIVAWAVRALQARAVAEDAGSGLDARPPATSRGSLP